jgi:FMN phosphatase YigB (HAD superfamily)
VHLKSCMNDPIELVTRIRYMMEYMTLCADPTSFRKDAAVHPSPSGVPMGIVTLPDFVVDIALDRISKAESAGGRQIHSIDIGGRTTRLAWALQMFGGETLGWYNTKLVTKAGNHGLVALRRRFCESALESGIDPLSLRYVIPTENGVDRLHVYGPDPSKENRPSTETELTIADIDSSSYALTDLFRDARYVIVASKETEHAKQAIQIVRDGLKRLSGSDSPIGKTPIGILIDFGALDNPEDAAQIVAAYHSLKEDSAAYDLFATAFCDERTREAASELDEFAHILIRTGDTVEFKGHQTPLALKNRPIRREAFTAGYVIASACDLGWRLLRQWRSYFPRMRPIDGRPHSSFPQSLPPDTIVEHAGEPTVEKLPSLETNAPDAVEIEERLAFATLLAKLTEEEPITYGEFVKAVWDGNGRPLDEIEQHEGIAWLASRNAKDEFSNLERNALSADHLTPRFEDAAARDTLSPHIPPKGIRAFASSCQLRDARCAIADSHQEITKAIMFDLDATLLDSDGLRRACWHNGLRTMFSTMFKEAGFPIGIGDLKVLIDVYQAYVYKNHERFQALLIDLPDIPPELQPCDFRQVWNHPYAWAALLYVLNLTGDLDQVPVRVSASAWRSTLDVHKIYPSFCGSDILDLPSLVGKLVWKSDGVSQLLRKRMGNAIDAPLNEYFSSRERPEETKSTLLKHLNEIIKGPSLMEGDAFRDFCLGPEAEELRKNDMTGKELMEFNRLALVAAYPQELSGCRCDVCDDLNELLGSRMKLIGERRASSRRLRDLLSRFKFEIHAGRTAFWDKTNYPCYPQARSCVEMLKAMPGCEVYIVTEGHEETQNNKLRCTGLDDLFPRERVLSTGAASAGDPARIDLTRLFQAHTHRKSGVEEVIRIIGEQAALLGKLTALLTKLEANSNLLDFLGNLLDTLQRKRHKRFYCAVLDAIRLKPESPARLLQSFLQKNLGAADAHIQGIRPIKFFMIGDRYDNDCEPLLDIPTSNAGLTGIGTCRLLSGSRAKGFCPPSEEPPRSKEELPARRKPTMFVCDTLAQIAHFLHTPRIWEGIDVLKVTPPVLLEADGGKIWYPTNAGGEGTQGLADLAMRFRDLAWARHDESLKQEFAIQDMLDQIERDLAGCDLICLAGFFDALRNNLKIWWSDPVTEGTDLLKGSLRILEGVNSWRRTLRRPLLLRRENADQTLEWVLGSFLLSRLNGIPVLITELGNLRRVAGNAPSGVIGAGELLGAIPYSYEGIAIVDTLRRRHRFEQDFRDKLRLWSETAHRLSEESHAVERSVG